MRKGTKSPFAVSVDGGNAGQKKPVSLKLA
jgi:hypothetical protein